MKWISNSILFYSTEALHCVRCIAVVMHARKTGQNLTTLSWERPLWTWLNWTNNYSDRYLFSTVQVLVSNGDHPFVSTYSYIHYGCFPFRANLGPISPTSVRLTDG